MRKLISVSSKDPFHHDLDLTAKAWMSFISFRNENFDRCLHRVNQFELMHSVTFHLSGLWVGQKLGIPSILIENFTWDWMLRFTQKNPLSDHKSATLRFIPKVRLTPSSNALLSKVRIWNYCKCFIATKSKPKAKSKTTPSTSKHTSIMITTGALPQYELFDALYGHSDQNFLLLVTIRASDAKKRIFFQCKPIPLSGSRLHPMRSLGKGIWNFSGIMGERHTLTECTEKFQGIFQIEEFSKKYAFGRDDPENSIGYWLNKTQDLVKIFSSKPKIENGSLQVARK